MRSTKAFVVLKHVIYTLLLLLLYVLQSTPGLLEISGIRPIWVVPAAISIAMFEGEFAGGVYGILAGLLCDVGGSSLFGFNAFFIGAFCIAAGLLVIYLLRCNLMGCVLFVLFSLLARGSIEFLFAYGMWGYANVWKIYAWVTVPTVAYSLVVTPLCFWLFRSIHERFAPILRN